MARRFYHSYEVCKCKHVTLGEIVYSIKEKGANSMETVAKITDAGTACKCCQSKDKDIGSEKLELYVEDILNKFKS